MALRDSQDTGVNKRSMENWQPAQWTDFRPLGPSHFTLSKIGSHQGVSEASHELAQVLQN